MKIIYISLLFLLLYLRNIFGDLDIIGASVDSCKEKGTNYHYYFSFLHKNNNQNNCDNKYDFNIYFSYYKCGFVDGKLDRPENYIYYCDTNYYKISNNYIIPIKTGNTFIKLRYPNKKNVKIPLKIYSDTLNCYNIIYPKIEEQ